MIDWSEELREWNTLADAFARDRLADRARGEEHHADPVFPALLEEMGKLGFPQLCADARLDGLEQGADALAAVLEPLCAVDATSGAAVYATAAAHLALRACRARGEAEEVPRDLAAGWLAWPAFHGLAEQPWPLLDEQGELRGRVEMLLLGSRAGHAWMPARTAGGSRLALVQVDLAHDGVRRGAPVRTLGLSAAGVADVELERIPCVVLAADVAGAFPALHAQLLAPVTAMLCGVMRGSVETARSYASERYQGGGTILGWGEVRRLLALMEEHLAVAAAVLGTLLRAPAAAAGPGETGECGALHVGSLACQVTTDGVQLLGGNGYMKEYGQEKRMRDARQLRCLLGGVALRRRRYRHAATATGGA